MDLSLKEQRGEYCQCIKKIIESGSFAVDDTRSCLYHQSDEKSGISGKHQIALHMKDHEHDETHKFRQADLKRPSLLQVLKRQQDHNEIKKSNSQKNVEIPVNIILAERQAISVQEYFKE